jgi:hypothetical protein
MATRLWIPRRVLNLQSPCLEQKNLLLNIEAAGVAQSVQCLTADWTNGFRCPPEAMYFSCRLCVQTSSEAHPASCAMGIGDPVPRFKGWPGVKLTILSHVVPRTGMISSYTASPPPSVCLACSATALAFSSLFRPSLRPAHPPVKWVLGIYSRG